MKKVFLFLVCLFPLFLSSQETEFTFTSDKGLTDYVVMPCDSLTKEELYQKTIAWINKYYHSPKDVIIAQVQNDYVRIQGLEKKLYCFAPFAVTVCNDVKYEIEISFKDGKYKFDIGEIKEYVEPSQYLKGGWNKLDLNNPSRFFKKSGEVKGGYKNHLSKITSFFNALNQSLYDYILNQNEPARNNDW